MVRKKPALSIILYLAAILPVTVFVVSGWAKTKAAGLPVLPGAVKNFSLKNQDNKEVTLKNWKGKIVVVDFFFTHCGTICPKMMSNLKDVQTTYAGDTSVVLNSFSVDPENDSVQQLKRYALRFGIDSQWNLFTGDKNEIYKIAISDLHLNGPDTRTPGFIHSEKLVLLDRQLRIRGYYRGTVHDDISQLISDIKKLQNEN